MPITVRELAIHRGAIEVDGSINGAEFERVGLPMMGGCESCEASIAAYNAYPSKGGYLRCRDCISTTEGYETVEEANKAIFGSTEEVKSDVYWAYNGVYQAYAWHQGYEDKPVKFRIPDHHFDPEPLTLAHFMEVVADVDNEGAIHYWKYDEVPTVYGCDRFLTLVCTEDNSIHHLLKEWGMEGEEGSEFDARFDKEFHHASWEGWNDLKTP